jgi:hypothetical protein
MYMYIFTCICILLIVLTAVAPKLKWLAKNLSLSKIANIESRYDPQLDDFVLGRIIGKGIDIHMNIYIYV